jgi:uncharacterized membrane protein YkvA (DUF1232 family)
MHSPVVHVLVGVGGGLLVVWVALMVALALARPKEVSLREAFRLLPDTLRLFKALAMHPQTSRRARVVLFLCLAYLASPIDLVPDFLPIIGHVDDAIVLVLALRWVARMAGRARIEECWPGSPAGLSSLLSLVRTSDAST